LAHNDLAQLVFVGVIGRGLARKKLNVTFASVSVQSERQGLTEQWTYVLSEQGVAARERVFRGSAGDGVAAAARRAAVWSMAACTTTAAVVVSTQNIDAR